MPRTKTGITRRRTHKKILKLAKGYRMTKSRLFKVANEAVLHAGQYSFQGRKKRKGQMRKLWIQRINAGLK
ncbi:50S ribosomal protein L20, partial [Patescibacteria group bacterium]|nr:50S ribosomal protein L20 [Patescibacteria group bacterium]